MKASELIEKLQQLMEERDADPEVLAQSDGCCHHGHKIRKVEYGAASDEDDAIVIRV